jgi:hypothetical protein
LAVQPKSLAWQMSCSGIFGSRDFDPDFVWILLSNLVLLFACLFYIVNAKQNRNSAVNAILCGAELLAFGALIHHVLYSGVLDFG